MKEMRELLDVGQPKRKKREGYQGHESWTAWNVSLWLNNDESMYRTGMDLLRKYQYDRNGKRRSRDKQASLAAAAMLDYLPTKTPDGAKYSKRSLMLALRDNIED